MKRDKFFYLTIKGESIIPKVDFIFPGFSTQFFKTGEESDFYGIKKIMQKSTRLSLSMKDQGEETVSFFLTKVLKQVIKIMPLIEPYLKESQSKMELVVYEKGRANHFNLGKNHIRLLYQIGIPFSVVLWEDN